MATLLYIFIVLPAVLMVTAICCAWMAMRRSRQSLTPIAPAILSISPPPKSQAEPFTVLSLADAFEPETAALWETQVPALSVIAAAGDDGEPLLRLRMLYAGLSRRFPELYDGSSFEEWLDFLESTSLVICDEDCVRMTSAGHAFLECRLPVHA